MNTVVKTVKQYSLKVNNIEELYCIAERYTTVKNYVYSRYSGINSILLLSDYKRQIRDIWVKSKFANQWKLPARYWKLALDEAIANIKSEWSNVKNRIKSSVFRNSNLTEDEKLFICYILKADKLLYEILTHKEIKRPDKIINLVIREKYILSLIRRYVRRYKGNVPYSNESSSFMIDADMYKYKITNNKLYIEIQGLSKGKRIEVQLKDNNVHKGNLRILLKKAEIEIHKAKKVMINQIWQEEKQIAVDKGYRCLIATSDNKFYGEHLNTYLSTETERLNEINKKRNQLFALMKKYEEEGNRKKVENILRNNLGKIKYCNNKRKFDSKVKGYINEELNRFIRENKPSEVVTEDLSFVSLKDKFPSHIKRKLSRWIKGYIEKRIDYKCSLNNIAHTVVNPAYTSQVCHLCGRFGVRNNEIFTCLECGEMDADYNAAMNLKARKYDKEISLYTPYKKVKEILLKRVS